MPPIIRNATADDAPLLVNVIDMASEGLIPAFWDEVAPDDMDGNAVGLAMVTAEDGEFSYHHGFVVEADGAVCGGMIGYPLPASPEPAGPEVPAVFVPVKELENLVPCYWYINVVAIMPEHRGQGLGTALLKEAEVQARSSECPGLALVVADSNAAAIRAYERAGYTEKTRRPFDLTGFGTESTEALLMVRDLH